MNEISASAGILDLYAPKFSLDGLGVPGGKVMIKVTVSSKDGRTKMSLYGSYPQTRCEMVDVASLQSLLVLVQVNR